MFEVWARVLAAVPDSRLVLKWRTFQDAALCQSVREAFAQRGIASERIELRGATFHADVLKQYADIDIALDPFPFSRPSAWRNWRRRMGDDYVRIAVELAADSARLAALRSAMRSRMQASPLMDVAGFTRQLENTLHRLYAELAEREKLRYAP